MEEMNGIWIQIQHLSNLQLTLFVMMICGVLLRKKGIFTDEGRNVLTKVCIDLIIPCSIIKSCSAKFTGSVFGTCWRILLVAALMQGIYMILNLFLFNRYPVRQKKVLQYCTIVSNGGFLGNPIAEGVYGDTGLFYASVFLIPMRIIMWSVGTSYFVAGTADPKTVLRKILTHPCLVATYIGMIMMALHLKLPEIVAMPLDYIGGCNAAMTMVVTGGIIADIKLSTIVNKTTVLFSIFRLLLLPAAALGLCRALGLGMVATGVSVMMTGMPAGATASIFASLYGSDAEFASKCVVLSTLLSIVTVPVWCWYIGF